MSKHILFTSRDVGAAHQIKHIVKEFKKEGFDVSILGSGNAFEVFKREGLNPRLYSIGGKPFVSKRASKGLINELLKSSYEIINRVRPDAVFCGLTTLDYGIDEAIMYWAASKRLGIPSFQFLDTWGTFNHFKDGYPDIYFAMDRASELLGSKGAKAPIRVVGSPKHFAYSTLDIKALRKKTRKELNLSDDEKMIGYFGQCPDVPGHTYNFKLLVDTIRIYSVKYGKCKFLLRPHPAYKKMFEYYWKYLNDEGIETVKSPEGYSVEEVLCACDVVFTHYSTTGVDHAFLNCYSEKPIGVVMYMLCGKEIKEFLLNNFGYWKIPILEEGIGFYVDNEDEIFDMVQYLLNDETALTSYFYLTKSLKMNNPSEKILDIVLNYSL